MMGRMYFFWKKGSWRLAASSLRDFRITSTSSATLPLSVPTCSNTIFDSSSRPRATSQRGLRGVRNSSPKNAAAGNASTPNIQRHSREPRPMVLMIQLDRYASRIPSTILNWVIATRRPRTRAGEISAIYMGEMTDAPPTARPPMKRNSPKETIPHARALPTAEVKYKTPSSLRMARRPYRSAGLPKRRAPITVPISAVTTTDPCQKDTF